MDDMIYTYRLFRFYTVLSCFIMMLAVSISVKTKSNIKGTFHVDFLWHDVSKNEDYGDNS